MIHLQILREDTLLLSTLCARCPEGPAGCCVAPPEYDWSDIGRVVLHGGFAWLLDQIAAKKLTPAARGLAVRRVRKREAPTLPRQSKCVFHGREGCTIDHRRRPATCNYFLCDHAFRDGGAATGEARAAHAILRDAYERWDAELGARVAARWPEGAPWDEAFVAWLAEETATLRATLPGELSALDPEAPSAMIPRMSKITLKLRDLLKGETSFKELPDEEAAIAFLRDRPRFTEVLGVVFEGLTSEQNQRLKAAMRPLDDAEEAAEEALEEKARQAAEAAADARQKEAEKAAAAHREAMKTADPNRKMEVRYRYDGSIAAVDPEDRRELSAEVRDAVMAWVAERNEWVESRNQVVGEAKITLWPGTLPKPGADRIVNGSFVPVTAAAKPDAPA